MLEKIADSIRNNHNIIEKKDIDPIVQYIDKNSFKSNKIFSDIGEDSASIKNKEKYILITTDRIKTDFIENFPYGAGFSSILVGVDDIYCCGGTPIAASIIISYKNEITGYKIIDGICEGSKKFQIPIIRGHTNPKSKCYELSSTIIGEIYKENYISAKGAKAGDDIILVVDFEGKVGKANKLYWDTVTFKDSEEIIRKRKSMNILAEQHLINASKDISNGGIFGTILQLIRFSKLQISADININKIKIPPKLLENGYDLATYIKMYLTTSYILTAPPEKFQQISDIFEKFRLKAEVIGKIIKEEPQLLKINNGKDSLTVIKL
ncbi:MAG: AIR synthase related protein [Candidatus Thorarchaeota archaeon]